MYQVQCGHREESPTQQAGTLPRGDRTRVFEDEQMCLHEKGLPFFVGLENFCSTLKTELGPPPLLASFPH